MLVPEWTTETHKVKAIQCAAETRECKVTVFHCVAETRRRPRECTEMVPETRTRTETFAVQVPTSHQETEQYQVCVPTFRDVVHTYTVAVPIWTQQEEKFTVMVPHTETRQASRQVVHCIPASETRMVCVDRGHWEQARTCGYSGCTGSACSGSCSGSACQRLVVRRRGLRLLRRLQLLLQYLRAAGLGPQNRPGRGPSDRHETADQRGAVSILRHSMLAGDPHADDPGVQLPERDAELHGAGVRDEDRNANSRTFTVCGFQTEQRSREVQFCVNVPQKRTWTEQVTNYRNVPEEKTEQYTVMVPHEVEREVCVQVCHMVAKEVPVQTCCSCDRCSPRLSRAVLRILIPESLP